MQLVHDYSPAESRNNVMALAKLGRVFKLPTVLTTSLGQGPNGPFIPEVLSLFPEVPVIDRPGIISAWDDPKFVAAIEETGRKNLIMRGSSPQFFTRPPGPSSRTEGQFGNSFARRIRYRNDQGFHITPEDRQGPPRHLQARALAKGGPEPSSSVLHPLI